MSFIKTFHHSISHEVCHQIIENYKIYGETEAERRSANLHGGVKEYSIQEECINQQLQKTISEIAERNIKDYLAGIPSLNEKCFYLNHMSIMVQSGGKNIAYHYDSEFVYMNGTEYIRNFAVLIYLNDSFENGEIIFPLQKEAIRPETGLMLIFPTSFMYPHITNPAMGDNRYVLRLSYFYKKEMIIDSDLNSKVY